MCYGPCTAIVSRSGTTHKQHVSISGHAHPQVRTATATAHAPYSFREPYKVIINQDVKLPPQELITTRTPACHKFAAHPTKAFERQAPLSPINSHVIIRFRSLPTPLLSRITTFKACPMEVRTCLLSTSKTLSSPISALASTAFNLSERSLMALQQAGQIFPIPGIAIAATVALEILRIAQVRRVSQYFPLEDPDLYFRR